MDFIEGLPHFSGNDTIFVVVDRLTKYAHFIGLYHPFMEASVAKIFIREVVRLHGVPHVVILDQGSIVWANFG